MLLFKKLTLSRSLRKFDKILPIWLCAMVRPDKAVMADWALKNHFPSFLRVTELSVNTHECVCYTQLLTNDVLMYEHSSDITLCG